MSHQNQSRRGRVIAVWVAGVTVLALAVGSGYLAERRETSQLARDARLVVRVPVSVVDRLTANEIHQEFPIQEQFQDFKITGRANATGNVSLQVEPNFGVSPNNDVVINVHVIGETDNELIGERAAVRIIGSGQGTFEAVKPIRFDGRSFYGPDVTQVTATHETEIIELTDLDGEPLSGSTKFLTSRKARQALPLLNAAARQRIESKVQEVVDQRITETIQRLNRVDRMDEALARLHPDMDEWTVRVSATNEFVQAALIPQGGELPQLPNEPPPTLEVWMRLTRSQRARIKLLGEWQLAHELFRQFVPPERAEQIVDDVRIAQIDGWTRLRIAARDSGDGSA